MWVIPICSAFPRTNRSDGCSINCTGHKKVTFGKRDDMRGRSKIWTSISNLRMATGSQWTWLYTGRDGPSGPKVPLPANGTKSGRTARPKQSKKWKTNEYKNNFSRDTEPVPILLYGQYRAEIEQCQYGYCPRGGGIGIQVLDLDHRGSQSGRCLLQGRI